MLSDDLSQNDRLTIAKAMDHIESDTCVKFVARDFLNPYYVHIGRECSCGSNRCAFNGAYANIGPGPLPGEKDHDTCRLSSQHLLLRSPEPYEDPDLSPPHGR